MLKRYRAYLGFSVDIDRLLEVTLSSCRLHSIEGQQIRQRVDPRTTTDMVRSLSVGRSSNR